MEILHSPNELFYENLSSLNEYLKDKKRVLIVTSAGSVKRGIIDNVKGMIDPFKELSVCDSVNGVPDCSSIDGLISRASQFKPDVILAIGGGSVADVGKIISVASSAVENIVSSDLINKRSHLNGIACIPIIFIVTLPGSSAELTSFATLWDAENKKKYSIRIKNLKHLSTFYPISIIKNAPIDLLLNSSLDALVHGFDSLWNVNSTALTRKQSVEAIRLLLNVTKKIINGLVNDEVIRMLIDGSIVSGRTINYTKTSICHSISYPLTLHHKIPHGIAVFLPLPGILDYVDSNNPNLLSDLYEKIPSKQLFTDLNSILRNPKINSYTDGLKTKSLYIYFDEMIRSERGINFNTKISDVGLIKIFNNLLSATYS